ncbi:hypothetical protein LMH73_010235 [Vibrio splendidus]|nr:hypothetical protein [Vibrio splendidus]MCC4882961.1 hypothetical protein [Vibrio splendidus]
MPSFVCDLCHSIENTANSPYRMKNEMQEKFGNGINNGTCLCSGCTPTHYADGSACKYSGWHNRFPRETGTQEWALRLNAGGTLKPSNGLSDLLNGIAPIVSINAPKVDEIKRKHRSLLD